MTKNNIRGVEKGHYKKPMALGCMNLFFLRNRGIKMLRVLNMMGMIPKSTLGTLWAPRLKMFYILYIF